MHEHRLRIAFGAVHSRQPVLALVQRVFNRDEVDVEAQRVDEATHPARRCAFICVLHTFRTIRRRVALGVLDVFLHIGQRLVPDLERR